MGCVTSFLILAHVLSPLSGVLAADGEGMKFKVFLYLVLLAPYSVFCSELEESEVLHLSGAVYSFMAEVGLCAKQFPELSEEANRSNTFFKSVIGKVETYYSSIGKPSKFAAVEKSGVNIAGRKVMQAMSSGGIAIEKCNTIIGFGSHSGFPEDLQIVVSKMGS